MKSKSKKNEQTKEKQALEKENAGLKKMYPDAMPGMKILQETIEKKVPGAAHRRDLARLAVSGKQCSRRKAATYFRFHRSTLRYRPRFPSTKKEEADTGLVDLSLEHPELGSDKVGRPVRNRGLGVSSKEFVRCVARSGLRFLLPKKQRRHGTSTGPHPTKAEYRGHVWRWDFIHDSKVCSPVPP